MVMDKLERYAHCHDLPLRVGLGLIFLIAGFGKLFAEPGIAGFSGMLAGIGFPFATFWAILVGVVEFAGAIALFIGKWTRYVAVALAVVLLVAIVTVSIPQNGFMAMPTLTNVALLGASISLIFSGSRSFCLDKAGKKKKEEKKE